MIYWIFLLGIILINFKYKKGGIFYLWFGLYLFCIASFVSIMNLISIAEVLMRSSFVFLLIGFTLAAKEYSRLI